MSEFAPDYSNQEDNSEDAIEKQAKLSAMKLAALRSVETPEACKDIIIKSLNQASYPDWFLDLIQSSSGETVLAILANKQMDDEAILDLAARLRRASDGHDEDGEPLIPQDEALTLFGIINSMTGKVL